MLSGEGNAGDRRKTTIGLNSKKNNNNNSFPHAAHFFFFHFLAVVLHDYNAKLPETVFLWGKCRTSYRSLFFTAAHFHLTLVAASISHSVVPATKFSYWLPTKNVSFFYLSLQISVALFLVEFCWPVAYSLFFSVFLLLYVPNLWT